MGSQVLRFIYAHTLDHLPTPVSNLVDRKPKFFTWHNKMADASSSMEQNVESILAAQKERYKSVQVSKDIGVHYDVGNLMVSDVNLLDSDALK